METENENNEHRIMISIMDLYKSFGDNHVLRGVNLEVENKENVVVLGRSGTGKSVLIKIICGLLMPDSGSVNVLGKEVELLNDKELQQLRLQIGFSFQSRVLDAVGLLQTMNQMPAELSGGQRKRIGIARTLILQPKIMLYDEPTSGLDPITSIEINKLINLVKEKFNTTSIIITHDLTCAKTTGDKVAMLFDGKFIKKGTFDEVFSDPDERIQNFYKYNFIH